MPRRAGSDASPWIFELLPQTAKTQVNLGEEAGTRRWGNFPKPRHFPNLFPITHSYEDG